MVKHGLGERPHSDAGTVATISCESFGSFLGYLGTGLTLFGNADAVYTYIRLLLDLIDDTRGELVDHDVTPPTTGTTLSSFLKTGIPKPNIPWKLTDSGHWRLGRSMARYVCNGRAVRGRRCSWTTRTVSSHLPRWIDHIVHIIVCPIMTRTS